MQKTGPPPSSQDSNSSRSDQSRRSRSRRSENPRSRTKSVATQSMPEQALIHVRKPRASSAPAPYLRGVASLREDWPAAPVAPTLGAHLPQRVQVRAALMALYNCTTVDAKLLRLALERQLPDKRPQVILLLIETMIRFAQAAMGGAETEIEVMHSFLQRAIGDGEDIAAEVVGTLLKGIPEFTSPLLAGPLQRCLLAGASEMRIVCHAILDCPWGCRTFFSLLAQSAIGRQEARRIDGRLLERRIRRTNEDELRGLVDFLRKCLVRAPGLPAKAGQGVREAGSILRKLESLAGLD